MRNIRLLIEYDGLEYSGWQRQPGLLTIQGILEDSLEKLVGRRTVLFGSSRTDSGVHAKGQVANFYVDEAIQIAPERWSYVLNWVLPRTIRILDSKEEALDFHAQKRVVSKIYEYRVLNRKSASALDPKLHFYPGALNWDEIARALPHFVGEHNFRAFQGAKAQVRTTIRRIYSFGLQQEEPGFFCFSVRGSGFLKQMVRTMIGTVLEVGEGKRSADDIPRIIASGDRRLAGRTAPANGLCLVSIQYEGESWSV